MGILRSARATYHFRCSFPTRQFKNTNNSCSNIITSRPPARRSYSITSTQCYCSASRYHPELRLLSTNTTSTTTDAASSAPASGAANKKDDKSNVFLDHLGSIFLAGIGLIVCTLTRSYMGSTNRNTAREKLQECSSLDPLEIDDLRVANSELDLPIYRKITADLIHEFPTKMAKYEDIVKTVRTTMKGLKGDAFTIQLGHLIDRVVLSALKEHAQSTEDPQPLAFWLTVLLLALNAPVPDRISALYEVLRVTTGDNDDVVTLKDARAMVGYLQDTCQLVPDSQIVPTEQKYPIQHYGKGNVGELFGWEGPETEALDVDAFALILRSRAVCAWGECYNKRKFA